MRKLHMLKQHFVGEQGFTLIEMVVALFIVSVVMAIALPNLQVTGVRAAVKGCEGNQKMLRAALTEYYLTNYQFPDSSSSSSGITEVLKANGYLDSTPTCPSGGTYDITYDNVNHTANVKCSVHGELGV